MSVVKSKYSRRSVIASLGGTFAATLLPARLLRAADDFRFKQNPFTLGVASGYPTTDSVVLWTRLAPSPLEPGGGVSRDVVVPVTWELASDDGMRKVLHSGVFYATSQWAHSVHAEPTDLEPGREYWYRFTAGGMRSAIGRTRTALRGDVNNDRMKIAVASCQHYEQGYFVAYRHMLADQLDLIVHVGDYIYEGSGGKQRVRQHNSPETMSLDDYRARYALYRGDTDLQNAHAACPWLVTWDDHELSNDYAGEFSADDDPRDWFLARRAAAYQAYYEHMPLPSRALPFGANLRLFAKRSFGRLANIVMLDTRQYRSPLACPSPGERVRSANCAGITDPARTMLGAAQESWLQRCMSSSEARWNIFASGTLMAYVDLRRGPGEMFWKDDWGGYAATRTRFVNALTQTQVANPLVLSGDIHCFMAANINRVPEDRASPLAATELVTTSISSEAMEQAALDARRPENPNLLFGDTRHRGYLRLDLTPERVRADLVAMDSVIQRDAGRSILASFVVENGKAGAIPNAIADS
jgi:alkaline phosphatase D